MATVFRSFRRPASFGGSRESRFEGVNTADGLRRALIGAPSLRRNLRALGDAGSEALDAIQQRFGDRNLTQRDRRGIRRELRQFVSNSDSVLSRPVETSSGIATRSGATTGIRRDSTTDRLRRDSTFGGVYDALRADRENQFAERNGLGRRISGGRFTTIRDDENGS